MEKSRSPGGNVHIAWMIRQYHHGIDMERITPLRLPYRVAQCIDLIDQQVLLPVEQVRGKEPATSGDEHTAVIWHRVMLE
jgi:hypothetical protein